ncbi:MAG: universal stress protein [Pseudomonadota bacterium]
MAKQSRGAKIRRIQVALDSSVQDNTTIQVAVHLAAMLRAELQGLFIQDFDLMRFADLPIAKEVISYSAIERRVDRAQLEKDLESQAKRISREFAQLAGQQKVRWSFETVRGYIESEVLDATERADLLIVHRKTGRTLVSHDQLGSTASMMATRSKRTVLILEGPVPLGQPLFVLVEESESGINALNVAVRLSKRNHRRLIVLIHTDSLNAFEGLRKEMQDGLLGRGREAEFSWLRKLEIPILSHKLWQEGGGVLIVAADAPFLKQTPLAQLIKQLKLPLVLVR